MMFLALYRDSQLQYIHTCIISSLSIILKMEYIISNDCTEGVHILVLYQYTSNIYEYYSIY